MKILPFLIISLILGLYLGNKFPDIDQRTDLLTHSSIFTHEFIVPLIIYLTCNRIKNSILRLFVNKMGYQMGWPFWGAIVGQFWHSKKLVEVWGTLSLRVYAQAIINVEYANNSASIKDVHYG